MRRTAETAVVFSTGFLLIVFAIQATFGAIGTLLCFFGLVTLIVWFTSKDDNK